MSRSRRTRGFPLPGWSRAALGNASSARTPRRSTLLAVREIVAAGIPGEALYGYVPAAGITKGFVPATAGRRS